MGEILLIYQIIRPREKLNSLCADHEALARTAVDDFMALLVV